jgi:4a-hydroxytetrahydrobiopterin dehydratase
MSIEQLAARRLPTLPHRLDAEDIATLRAVLPPEWGIEGEVLHRTFAVDYATGVGLIVDIGGIAEEMNHHPELTLRWGSLTAATSTHDVGGLSELDFILAAKIEQIAAAARTPE